MDTLLEIVGVVVVLPRDREVWVGDQPRLQLVLQLQRVRRYLLCSRVVDTSANAGAATVVAVLLCVAVSCMFIGGVLHRACVGTKRNEVTREVIAWATNSLQ